MSEKNPLEQYKQYDIIIHHSRLELAFKKVMDRSKFGRKAVLPMIKMVLCAGDVASQQFTDVTGQM